MILSAADLLVEVMALELVLAVRLDQVAFNDPDDVAAFWQERRFGSGAVRAFGAKAYEHAARLLAPQPGIRLATIDGRAA